MLPPYLPIAEAWEVPFEEISDLQWVGSGAQGAVFLGKLHGQEVAVKKVRNIKETDIKHLRKLKHPNIITFKLVGMISWLIMSQHVHPPQSHFNAACVVILTE